VTLDSGEHSGRWRAGIFGAVGFLLIGLTLLPGFVSRIPTPVDEMPPPSQEHPPASSNSRAVLGAQERDLVASPNQPSAAAAHSQTFDCMITPNETVDIGSSITGVIESISVERSSSVEAGQILTRLESSVEEAAVRVAEAQANRTVDLESRRASLELGNNRRARAVYIFEGNTLSLDIGEEIETDTTLAQLGVEEAEENHKLAQLQLEQARAALERRTIRSPISGFVVERLMAPGEVVDDQTILRIAQVDPLRVDVILPAHLFGTVEMGDAVEIIPEAPLDRARAAEVSIVDRIIDGGSGTFGVTLELPNPNHDLPGGLRCQARLLQSADQKVESVSLSARGSAPTSAEPLDDPLRRSIPEPASQ
jgi:RND family efflux transporter MFP subunit